MAHGHFEFVDRLIVRCDCRGQAQFCTENSYLRLMYKNATETTTVDYTVVGVVKIGEDEYLTAANKWLLAHEESAEAKGGAKVGLKGVNIDIAGDL